MTTALTDFIEYLESIQKRDNVPNWIISTAKNHLEIEKQQIINAVNFGFSNWDNDKESEQYYKENYAKN